MTDYITAKSITDRTIEDRTIENRTTTDRTTTDRAITDKIITESLIDIYRQELIREEKSVTTVEKYLRDVHAFFSFTGQEILSKELVMTYKQHLVKRGYAVRSINSMLGSVNSFLEFLGCPEYRVKSIRQQRQIYCAEEKELTKAEYLRLLDAAKRRPQLRLVMQTICGTGIRVSELRFFTVEAVKRGEVSVNCKAKTRTILLPQKLQRMLLEYARKNCVMSGSVFITHNGQPLDRSNIWKQMKKLCVAARVRKSKVFPHNLRKLFARTFYGIEKDIAKLADILGHSSIDTTRIYIMSTGVEHRKKIERLGLVV